MHLDFSVLFEWQNLTSLLSGFWVTIYMVFFSLIVSLTIGMAIGIGRMSSNKAIVMFCKAYLSWFRGTPVLVQLMILYYGLAIGLKVDLSATAAGIIGLGMYSGSYVSEIVRGAIQSIDKGQTEAGRSLGLSKSQTMWKIILPQAVRRMLPPLGNEIISLTKNSSLLSIITVREVMRAGNLIVSYNFKYFEVYIGIAIMYFILNYVISKIVGYFEHKLMPGGVLS